ncbi:MAG TPA: EamA family transporter [Actinophytocola sp.]|uniref:EamA family transporter n=1 Tax=Actinophytocola sp. TaxID=1872138 RepID=UPI002DDCDBC9|nr:EamA family transporter [Actinophytocola sp.]HEV2778674.1 EamA family transporter [Actinophytocola sp.]
MMRISTVPAPAYFGVSAIFHYLGPAFAVLLFAHIDVLGVAWLRIASAALVFALWRRPWRLITRLEPEQRRLLLALGVVLAAMNAVFYLAIARLPLSTVGAIEFLGVIVLAAVGVRTRRNAFALVLAVGGVVALTDVRIVGEPLGIALAFANCGLFMLYVVLGHRIANTGPGTTWRGIDQLGAAMLIAAVVALPFGIGDAAVAFDHPTWLLAGIGVGICSSVIPYVTDQLAMARLRRSTFALMMSILPAVATVIGMLVLAQLPTGQDLAGVALVIAGVAIHQQEENSWSKPGWVRRVSRSRPSVSA